MLALHRIGNPRCDQAARVRLRAMQGMLFRVRARGPAGRSSLEGYANLDAVLDVVRAGIKQEAQEGHAQHNNERQHNFFVHAP